MRTLMLIASVAMIGTGIFCVANSSAAFISVAFIVGLVLIALGVCEVVSGRVADFDRDEVAISLAKDGIILLVLGIVVISGQITDDSGAQVFFGICTIMEGVLSFRTEWLDVTHIARGQRINMGISGMMVVVGIYMLFNTSAFRLQVIMLIGFCLVLLGLRRFLQSFTIEYTRPSFITGNEEKLLEAREDEKRALAKAKEGIREQKNAQRRIRKIEEDIAAEQDLVLDSQFRRREAKAEEELGAE